METAIKANLVCATISWLVSTHNHRYFGNPLQFIVNRPVLSTSRSGGMYGQDRAVGYLRRNSVRRCF